MPAGTTRLLRRTPCNFPCRARLRRASARRRSGAGQRHQGRRLEIDVPRRAPADGRQKAASFDRPGERSSAFGGQKAARKSWPSTPTLRSTEETPMRKSLLALVASCAFLLASSPQAQTEAPSADARVIVKYKADSPLLADQALPAAAQRAERARVLGTRVGLALRAGSGVSRRAHVVFAHGLTSAQLAERLSREADVEYAVPDQRRRISAAPNDPLYLAGPPVVAGAGGPAVGQWYLRAPAGEVQSSINVEPAWDLAPTNSDIVVGVIDTGVRFDHPDLQRATAGGKLLPGYDMISDIDVANDGDGRDADASDPGDYLTLSEVTNPHSFFYQCDTAAEDSSWHGTQTSALIGALTNNAIGMAGVARNVRILPVRAMGKCGGFDSDILAAMRWAAGLDVPGTPVNPTPARVLN